MWDVVKISEAVLLLVLAVDRQGDGYAGSYS
jgi:hypothetical protein